MPRRADLSKATVAALTFGLALLLVGSLLAPTCRRAASAPAVVIVDTVVVDTVKKEPKARKARKKKASKPAPQPRKPLERDYLDEEV